MGHFEEGWYDSCLCVCVCSICVSICLRNVCLCSHCLVLLLLLIPFILFFALGIIVCASFVCFYCRRLNTRRRKKRLMKTKK